MSDTPKPHSFSAFVGDMLNSLFSRTGITGLPIGDPLLTIIELAAQGNVRAEQAIFELLASISLDDATGDALLKIAADENVIVQQNTAATGSGRFFDTSFEKISSQVYSGSSPLLIGSTSVKIADGSSFPTTGSVYIGRGTVNLEGPLAYSAIVDNGAYWTITLSSATSRFHNTLESVTLAQGGTRNIAASTVVETALTDTTTQIQYRTLDTTTIPDGEVFSSVVGIVCNIAGSQGNVTQNAIKNVPSAPFPGAQFVNDLPINTGFDAWSETQIKEAVRLARQSRVKGTGTAIINAVRGLVDTTENKRINSASLVSKNNQPSVLYIDDGTGYEEIDNGIGLETLVDSAHGGEQYFTLAAPKPIAKANVVTTASSPFQLSQGATLTVKTGGSIYEHSFDQSEFLDIANADAFEVAASINANATLPFNARVSDNFSRVTLFSKYEENEEIEVLTNSTNDANLVLKFPSGINYTLKLYKNDVLLYKDGQNAALSTASQSNWSPTIGSSGSETLVVSVDGRQSVSYTFTAADFINADSGVSFMSLATPLSAWAAVFNSKIVGITASVDRDHLVLTSNLGVNSGASVEVFESGSSLVNPGGMFSSENSLVSGITPNRIFYVDGVPNDYTLNRSTGQIELSTALSEGDSLSAGSTSTRAFIRGTALSPTLTISGSDAHLWVAVDGTNSIVTTNINSTTTFTVSDVASTSSTNRIRFTLNGGSLINGIVVPGNRVVIWDSNLTVNGMVAGAYMVCNVGNSAGNDFFEIEHVISGFVPFGPVTLNDVTGLVFASTEFPIQTITVPNGTSGLTNIVSAMNSSLNGAIASLSNGVKIVLTTNTLDSTGSVLLITSDTKGQQLSLLTRVPVVNQASNLGFSTSASDLGHPDMALNTIPFVVSSNSSRLPVNNVFKSMGGFFNWEDSALATLSSIPIIGANKNISIPTQTVTQTQYPIDSWSYDGATLLTISMPGGNTGLVAVDFIYIETDSNSSSLRNGFYQIGTIPDATHVTVSVDLGTNPFTETISSNAYLNLVTLRSSNSAVSDVRIDKFNSFRPFALSAYDNLSVIVDKNEVSQNYNIPMYRRVTPNSSQYVKNNFNLLDKDNGNASLFSAWGSFDFSDFAVYKPSVAIFDNGDVNSKMKFTNSRIGPEGNGIGVRFVYADGASQTTKVTTTSGTDRQYFNIHLPSGPALGLFGITNDCAPSASKVAFGNEFLTEFVFGFDAPALTISSSGAGVPFTIDLSSQLPGVTFSNLSDVMKVGGQFYLYNTTPDVGIPNGIYTVASVGPTSLTTVEQASMAVSNTVTYALAFCNSDTVTQIQIDFTSLTPGQIIHSDLFREGYTGSHSLYAVSKWSFTYNNDSPTIAVYPDVTQIDIESTDNISFFVVSGSTATAISTAINSSYSSYLTASLFGTGASSILTSTADDYASALINFPYFKMMGGINFIDSSTVDVSNSKVTFKIDPTVQEGEVSGANSFQLSSEEWRLVPVLAKDVSRYLEAPAVSSLFANSDSLIANNAHHIQTNTITVGSTGSVQVTGGTANSAGVAVEGTGEAGHFGGSVTVKTSGITGLTNGWCLIENPDVALKTIFDSTDSVTLSGTTFTSSKTLGEVIANISTGSWRVFKEGKFARYNASNVSLINNYTIASSTDGGVWVNIRSDFNASNQGLFRVVKLFRGGFWVENANAVDEFVSSTTSDYMQFLTSDSVVPGDTITIANDILGASNVGEYTVLDIPTSVGTFSSVTVDRTFTAASGSLKYAAPAFYIKEGTPAKFYKELLTMVPNNTSGFTDLWFDGELNWGKISAGNGTIITAQDKFDFPITTNVGKDGYEVATGLIHTANQTLFGVSEDNAVYPGVVASGSNLNIEGPLIKKVQISLGVRVISGTLANTTATQAIVNTCKSAVATVINQSPVGLPIAISSIVEAVAQVGGVQAVSVLSPVYNESNDSIPVQPFEKALVINLDTDVLINVVGG